MFDNCIQEYRNHLIVDRLNGDELQVGDVVYYLSPLSKYSIRKSTIKEKKIIPAEHHLGLLDGCELTLADGNVVDYYNTFRSKEKAIDHVIDSLRYSITNNNIRLRNLQREIEKEKRLLKMMEGKR